MHLHEYQAQILLKRYGIPFPRAGAISSLDELDELYSRYRADKVIIKAQIHAGGRGKAGGVKIVDNLTEARDFAQSLLGQYLVTKQTDSRGLPINHLLVSEVVSDIVRELYVGLLIDRSTGAITFILSTEGGMDIEKVAQEQPEKVLQVKADFLVGIPPYKIREAAYQLGLKEEQFPSFINIIQGLYDAFIQSDLSLLELNPLGVLSDGSFIALDSKITVDENALFRQPELAKWRDRTQENETEQRATELGLNYVALEGNIGCMVNGAGLAMATMDIIKLYGAEPANFLDVGGGTTKERVVKALELILTDEQVEGIFINIFGGIVRCDLIAEALIEAMDEIEVTLPIVVRLEGNRAAEGLALLKEAALPLTPIQGLAEAAKQIIEKTEKQRRGH